MCKFPLSFSSSCHFKPSLTKWKASVHDYTISAQIALLSLILRSGCLPEMPPAAFHLKKRPSAASSKSPKASPSTRPRVSQLSPKAAPHHARSTLPLTADIEVSILPYPASAQDVASSLPTEPLWQVQVQHTAKPSVLSKLLNSFTDFLTHLRRTNDEVPETIQELKRMILSRLDGSSGVLPSMLWVTSLHSRRPWWCCLPSLTTVANMQMTPAPHFPRSSTSNCIALMPSRKGCSWMVPPSLTSLSSIRLPVLAPLKLRRLSVNQSWSYKPNLSMQPLPASFEATLTPTALLLKRPASTAPNWSPAANMSASSSQSMPKKSTEGFGRWTICCTIFCVQVPCRLESCSLRRKTALPRIW